FQNGERLPSEIDPSQPSHYIAADRDKLGARYSGKGNHDHDVGAVRANFPLPRFQRAFYFEARVVSAGRDASITVGLVGEGFPLNKQPGTEPESYGYRGNNGRVYGDSPRGREFGPSFSTDDTVGLGVKFSTREVFITLNGQLLGVAFRGAGNGCRPLYPSVSLHSPGEAVRVNFGQRPFLFDLGGFQVEEDGRRRAARLSVAVSPSLVRELVRDYLMHQ
ncbi:unnamed protein product, partial [Choristocarpus tenellus]